ncbi:MAG: hypothetical protein KDA28_00095 [Phycisphaerales bacterium]|nr:hypothetical protein [Phycisphaerales bacterium]
MSKIQATKLVINNHPTKSSMRMRFRNGFRVRLRHGEQAEIPWPLVDEKYRKWFDDRWLLDAAEPPEIQHALNALGDLRDVFNKLSDTKLERVPRPQLERLADMLGRMGERVFGVLRASAPALALGDDEDEEVDPLPIPGRGERKDVLLDFIAQNNINVDELLDESGKSAIGDVSKADLATWIASWREEVLAADGDGETGDADE